MNAVSMICVRCAECAARATLSVASFERGIYCAECGGTLTAEREVPKSFGKGLCRSQKYRFNTRSAAIAGQRAHRRRASKTCVVYRCRDCGGWHLGHSLGRVDR